ncbi:MAG: TRAP transporter TatT component family protein [Spirochaetaceae bacterium]|jgi:predicted anti-sigma-YlaC factor YlaD|nr:TRAP transporter TatT component family protein [Spirochaetaceae bacterium]
MYRYVLFVLGALICEASFLSCMTSPTVVGIALPHLIRRDEGRLLKTPGNAPLRLETGSYYVMYANAFIEGPAKMLPPDDYEERDVKLARAKQTYLRGVTILREGLDRKYPGMSCAYASGKLDGYLERLTKDDVPAVYWMVAGTLAAYSLDPFDLDLGFKIPELAALMARAYKLDPDFNNGALDDFYILFYGALPPALGGDREKAKKQFEIALKKTNNNAASPYISYVEAIAIPEQDRKKFDEYLDKALKVNLGAMKTAEEKLATKIAQKKARFYQKNAERFVPLIDQSDEE